MKVFLMLLVGLIVAPVFWALQKLGILKPPPTVTGVFEALQSHLFRNGLSAVAEPIPSQLSHSIEAASFRFGMNPTQLNVAIVTRSADAASAALVEDEARGAPQFSGVKRNGVLVMACTFSPENPALEEKIGSAFMSFKHFPSLGVGVSS